MKNFFSILIVVIPIILLANHAPIVEDVTFIQREDGSHNVDIYFNLIDQDGDQLTVTIFASNDAGQSWDFPINTLSGDFGENISPGSGRHIVWDFAADHPDVLEPNMQFKITVSDGFYEPVAGMVFVEGGSFEMGDHFNEGGSGELPVHTVTLNSFYIGHYEVTQGEYEAVMGGNPAHYHGVGEAYPVYYVSWYNAVEYCNALSIQEGLTPCYDTSDWSCDFGADGYRLPTEAEWEYASRGGINWEDNYRYSGTTDNLGDYAWYNSNSGSQTHEVGTKLPNQLDIYDMSGNVYEWCNDWYGSSYYGSSPEDNPVGPDSGYYRVRRGGCWFISAYGSRVAYRNPNNPGHSGFDMGFRILRAYSY